MIIVSKFIVRKGYAAMAIFPFIFFKKKEYINPVRLNHERIHLRQQLELLLIFFYLWYLIDFIVKYAKYRNWKTAYRNIIFEREAYSFEKDLNYLKKRKFYNFIR
ncbi:hypothetical protein FORMB_16740 [Formosa sp. Hel1_33_131]|uniref:hypothetical protein n=1 Tax=Formosa sp. Hel1_33_131 TaxID=1336794 RepID=UPI00084E0CCB|nr:hypothetical protein [Formosa sp. Hel1_33_131]AOR28713.1 hypothetical protein FORMB_16740 [Formosa sp. Hel1_33_131]